jgi:hypothetical protein
MSSGPTEERQFELAWGDHNVKPCLWVRGWSSAELSALARTDLARLDQRLAVFPADVVQEAGDPRALQPIAGRYVLDGDAVGFIPRFPFVDGLRYAVVLEAGWSRPEVLTILRPDRAEPPTTTVTAIYPSTTVVPVNLLKLYVHFSAPMSEGWAPRAIQMIRAETGEPLQDPFVLMEPELWDPDRRRLTVLLDPGRIKRGLVPNAEAGYPLVEGTDVILRVDASFQDAASRPLMESFERRYQVGPELRARIDPRAWKLSPPAADTRERLDVVFDRPLDHALLHRCLAVSDAAGQRVAGRILVGSEERCAAFEPDAPWQSGSYVLTIDPLLEDLAGNSVVRVFDRDLTQPEDDPSDETEVVLGFRCDPA